MDFEWDDDKAEANWRKHRVSFDEAARVFDDPMVFERDDPERNEQRSNAIGLVEGRLLFVVYTMRGDVCRIVSARGAKPHEKRQYHEV